MSLLDAMLAMALLLLLAALTVLAGEYYLLTHQAEDDRASADQWRQIAADYQQAHQYAEDARFEAMLARCQGGDL